MKDFIKNRLEILLEINKGPSYPLSKTVKTIPQDPDAELNAISNPWQKHVRAMTSTDMQNVMSLNTQAKQVSLAYRKAFKNNEENFSVVYKGQNLFGNIPSAFRQDPDNINYFDDTTMGDGGLQLRMDKRGYLQASNVKAAPKMASNPHLGSATDAGSFYDYQGTYRYFRIKVGMLGKYQAEKYSIFITPSVDAEIKTRVCFNKEMMQFLQTTSYIDSDAKDIANNSTDLFPMIKTIRLKAEEQLGPISHLPFWKDFIKNFEMRFKAGAFNPDIDKEVQDVINKYKESNLFRKQAKPEISMPSAEKDAWDQEQKAKADRLAAWKSR